MLTYGVPKPFQITPQDEPSAVWSAYKKTTCGTEKRRLQVIALLLEGKSRKEVEAVTHYHRNSLGSIISRYNESGLTSLRNLQRENSGRPPRLNREQRIQIAQDIETEIGNKNYWNANKLIAYVERNFGIKMSETSAYRLFKELGFSLQTPRPSHIKGNERAQEEFKGKS